MPTLALVVATILLLTSVLPAPGEAQSLDESLAAARAERDRVQRQLDAAADELADIERHVAELTDERDRLRAQIAEHERVADETMERLSSRIRALYKRGATDPVLLTLGGGDMAEVAERAEIMDRLVFGDRVQIEVAEAARARARELAGRLAEAESALADQQAAQQAVLDDLSHALDRAQALESRLEAEQRRREEARRREAERRRREAEARARARSRPAPVSSAGGMACPVASPRSFTDTWGAPRSGGRRHRGTDILAPHGQRVIAIVSGVWDVRSYGRSAGNWGILRGNDGNTYWYMHLQSHLVGDGARVQVGQVIATNGNTGNAVGGPAHVHFELHPGGGSAVNPYPTLKRICG